MLSVPIANEWVETAQLFGDIESVIKDALRSYSIEKCQLCINEAASQIASYNRKYSCDYDRFRRSVQTDKNFLARIESQNPLWEEDAMEWEYWIEEQQTWSNLLGDISRR